MDPGDKFPHLDKVCKLEPGTSNELRIEADMFFLRCSQFQQDSKYKSKQPELFKLVDLVFGQLKREHP